MVLNYFEVSSKGRQQFPDFRRGFAKIDALVESLRKKGQLPEKLKFGSLPIKQAVEQFTTLSHTPELYTETFRSIWQDRQDKLVQKGVEMVFDVPDCPYTQEEIEKLESEGKRLGYLPPGLSGQNDRMLLDKLWPKMASSSLGQNNSVDNQSNRFGWFDYEASIEAPYTDTTEDKLKQEFERQGRLGMNLNEYVVAGQDSKLFTGQYLDETTTIARLLGSRYDGRGVSAGFCSDGRLDVGRDLVPQDRNPRWGGRSVGVKKS